MLELHRGARSVVLASLVGVVSAPPSARPLAAADGIVINDNRTGAGTLSGNVLTVRLEAREGEWHPDSDKGQAIRVRAFGESGKRLSVPGPLIRVVEGTEIHAFVKNAIAGKPLIIRGYARHRGSRIPGRAD